MQCLQAWLCTVDVAHRHSLQKLFLSMPMKLKDSLLWWTQPKNSCVGVPFLQLAPTMILTTDASLICWGAHLHTHTVQGRWSLTEFTLHINLLELQEVCNACLYFLPLITHCTIRVMTDNSACMFYINRQGRARSHLLCLEALKL